MKNSEVDSECRRPSASNDNLENAPYILHTDIRVFEQLRYSLKLDTSVRRQFARLKTLELQFLSDSIRDINNELQNCRCEELFQLR